MIDGPPLISFAVRPLKAPMLLLLRILRLAVLPLLGLSGLTFLGLGFGGAFMSGFTITNKSTMSVKVAPVGVIGRSDDRYPLPLYVKLPLLPLPPFPFVGSRCFTLLPGDSTTMTYDMDDINFSEIAVAVESGAMHQLVVNPSPELNQYHAPLQKHFEIVTPLTLPPASKAVQYAAEIAERPSSSGLWVYAILFGPPITYAALAACEKRVKSLAKAELSNAADSR
jgi:hypothetical protein